jgi:alanyl aminopeptidase
MENVGLITYGAQLILARAHEETSTFPRDLRGLASHEIAHYVVRKPRDPRLVGRHVVSEVLRLVDRVEGHVRPCSPSGTTGSSAGSRGYGALRADRLGLCRASIASPVESRNAIDDAFDDITYNKGEEVLSMFEAYIGPGASRPACARSSSGTPAVRPPRRTSSAPWRGFGQLREAAVAALAAFVNQPGAPLPRRRARLFSLSPGPLGARSTRR